MRKTFFVLALSCAVVMAFGSDASAQRRGGRGGGYYSRGGGYYGRGGGYYGRGWGGVSIGIGAPYYGGYYGRGYYDGGYYYPDTYSYPPDYYPADTYVVPSTSIQQSYYPQSSAQAATVQVTVPDPAAKIWFNGAATSQQGMNRTFYTPPLEPGNYTYTVKARWMHDGKAVERERTVTILPGQTASVDFKGKAGESLPLPKGPK